MSHKVMFAAAAICFALSAVCLVIGAPIGAAATAVLGAADTAAAINFKRRAL